MQRAACGQLFFSYHAVEQEPPYLLRLAKGRLRRLPACTRVSNNTARRNARKLKGGLAMVKKSSGRPNEPMIK